MTEKPLPIITPIKDGPLRVENLATFEGVGGEIQTVGCIGTRICHTN